MPIKFGRISMGKKGTKTYHVRPIFGGKPPQNHGIRFSMMHYNAVEMAIERVKEFLRFQVDTEFYKEQSLLWKGNRVSEFNKWLTTHKRLFRGS